MNTTEELDLVGASKEDTNNWINHDAWACFIVVCATLSGIVACWNMFS